MAIESLFFAAAILAVASLVAGVAFAVSRRQREIPVVSATGLDGTTPLTGAVETVKAGRPSSKLVPSLANRSPVASVDPSRVKVMKQSSDACVRTLGRNLEAAVAQKAAAANREERQEAALAPTAKSALSRNERERLEKALAKEIVLSALRDPSRKPAARVATAAALLKGQASDLGLWRDPEVEAGFKAARAAMKPVAVKRPPALGGQFDLEKAAAAPRQEAGRKTNVPGLGPDKGLGGSKPTKASNPDRARKAAAKK